MKSIIMSCVSSWNAIVWESFSIDQERSMYFSKASIFQSSISITWVSAEGAGEAVKISHDTV